MTDISEHLGRALTKKRITMFDQRLTTTHVAIPHTIMPIPKGMTLMDALAYVFENDALAISSVIQDYLDNNGFAKDLFAALEQGIENKTICLTCVRRGVQAFSHRTGD